MPGHNRELQSHEADHPERGDEDSERNGIATIRLSQQPECDRDGGDAFETDDGQVVPGPGWQRRIGRDQHETDPRVDEKETRLWPRAGDSAALGDETHYGVVIGVVERDEAGPGEDDG